MVQTPIIEAQNITQTFLSDKNTEHLVLSNVSLSLKSGEIVAILGRSGTGKSTLLRILAGLMQPTEGSVTFKGEALTGPNPGVGFVFQTFALMPWLDVQENVELGLEARGVGRAERRELALKAIDMIGLDGFESAYPKELSGGMRQRVGIARALVLRPEALFMDEPFSALDVLTAENLRQEVLSLWNGAESGLKTVLMVTHNIEEAVLMADRVIVLGANPGRVAADVEIDLPRPRDRQTAEFESYVDQLYMYLSGQERETSAGARVGGAAGAGAGGAKRAVGIGSGNDVVTTPHTTTESDRTSAMEAIAAASLDGGTSTILPDISPGALAGLVEVLSEYPKGVDLADLATLLAFEVNDLFPMLDAGSLLHMLEVHGGRVYITAEGLQWAKSSILEAKDFFANLVLRTIPLIRNITHALEKSESGGLRGDIILTLLRGTYPEDQAQQQFNTAIEWGRYAELFDYDADDDELTLPAVTPA